MSEDKSKLCEIRDSLLVNDEQWKKQILSFREKIVPSDL